MQAISALVLEKGIEPSRDKSHRILSPSRLPVPTLQHIILARDLSEGLETM